MQSQPLEQHRWLEKLVGEWAFESECNMGPDQPPMKAAGKEVVRSFGGVWTVAEGEAETPEGSCQSIITLGYDPSTQRFVGTFIATLMTHLWIYNGSLDAAARVLTLDTTGPNFTDGKLTAYQDIIEILDADHRTLASRLRGDDGQWLPFMKASYRRV